WVIAAQNSQPGAVVVAPSVWQVAGTIARDIEPKHHRQVHEHNVLGAQREVVHHGQAGNIETALNSQLPRRVRAMVRDIRASQAAIAKKVQLAGSRADLR